jgi:transcriptional regulator with XRE-family HTH domain
VSRRFDGAALGARIKLLRDLRGMTLQQVADASGMTKSHVWELEAGKSFNPSVNAVWGLAEALTVTPAQILGLDDRTPAMSNAAARIAGIVDREIKAARAESARQWVQLASEEVKS